MEVSVIICRVEYNPSAKGISLMAFSRVHSRHTFLNTPPMFFLWLSEETYINQYTVYIYITYYHQLLYIYKYNSQLTANTFLSNQSFQIMSPRFFLKNTTTVRLTAPGSGESQADLRHFGHGVHMSSTRPWTERFPASSIIFSMAISGT